MVRLHFLAVYASIGLTLSQGARDKLPSRTKYIRAIVNGTGMGHLPYKRAEDAIYNSPPKMKYVRTLTNETGTNGTGPGRLPNERGGGGGGGGHGSGDGGDGGGHSSSSGYGASSGGRGSGSGHGGGSGAATLSAPNWLVAAGVLIALNEYVPLPVLFPFAAGYASSEIIPHPGRAIIPKEMTQTLSPLSNITHSILPTDKKGKSGGGGCLTCSGAATLSARQWLAKAGLLVALSQYIALPILILLFASYATATSMNTGVAAPLPTAMARKNTLANRQLVGWGTLSGVPITDEDGSFTLISVPPSAALATAVGFEDAVPTGTVVPTVLRNETDKILIIKFGAAPSLELAWALLGLSLATVVLTYAGPLVLGL